MSVELVCSNGLILPGPFWKSDPVVQPSDGSLYRVAFEHLHLHGKCGLGTAAV